MSASEINAFLGRVISPILSLRMLKSYALGSVGVNDKVSVPLIRLGYLTFYGQRARFVQVSTIQMGGSSSAEQSNSRSLLNNSQVLSQKFEFQRKTCPDIHHLGDSKAIRRWYTNDLIITS